MYVQYMYWIRYYMFKAGSKVNRKIMCDNSTLGNCMKEEFGFRRRDSDDERGLLPISLYPDNWSLLPCIMTHFI